jgi:hypothetical protein
MMIAWSNCSVCDHPMAGHGIRTFPNTHRYVGTGLELREDREERQLDQGKVIAAAVRLEVEHWALVNKLAEVRNLICEVYEQCDQSAVDAARKAALFEGGTQ